MADHKPPTRSRGVGGAGDSSPSMSANRGPSDVAAARQVTDPQVLAEELEVIHGQQRLKGPRCATGATLAALPDDLRLKVERLLAEPAPSGQYTSATLIADTLTRAGYPVGGNSVMRHRRTVLRAPGGCACDR